MRSFKLFAGCFLNFILVNLTWATEPQRCVEYLRTEAGQPIGVHRIESMWGMPVRVIDVSQFVRERTTQKMFGLKVFQVGQVFAEPTYFLGFGRPNVYQAIPIAATQDVEYAIYAAKSLRRTPSKIEDSRGWAQSGVLVVPRNLSSETIGNIMQAAKARVGSRSWTCVNENCRVLGDVGFTVGGEPIGQYYFPMPLLMDMLRYGLELNGQPVEFDVVRTTHGYLEHVRSSVNRAVIATPCRHADRQCNENRFVVGVKQLGRWTQSFIFTAHTSLPLPEARVTRLPPSGTLANFDVRVSSPSNFGTLMRTVWGPHTLFSIGADAAEVNAYLPEVLKEFPQSNPSLFTKLKMKVLFAPPVVNFVRKHLASGFREFREMSEKRLYDMLRTESSGYANKYNLVVTGDSLHLSKNNIHMGIVDWVLSKHVLISGYSKDVRFAGEIWKEADGRIYLSFNSGTYRPTLEQLHQALAYLRKLFPNVPFELAPNDV